MSTQPRARTTRRQQSRKSQSQPSRQRPEIIPVDVGPVTIRPLPMVTQMPPVIPRMAELPIVSQIPSVTPGGTLITTPQEKLLAEERKKTRAEEIKAAEGQLEPIEGPVLISEPISIPRVRPTSPGKIPTSQIPTISKSQILTTPTQVPTGVFQVPTSRDIPLASPRSPTFYRSRVPITSLPASRFQLPPLKAIQKPLPTFSPIPPLPSLSPRPISVQSQTKTEQCCICMDRRIPSQNLVGCLHPVCDQCLKELGRISCPICRKPLAPISNYVKSLIQSKQMQIEDQEAFREEMIQREQDPLVEEDVDQLYQLSYS